MRLYLVGYMGCGKTTLGKKVASKLKVPFIDTDQVFEKKYQMSIVNFFHYFGEDVFRELERDILFSTTEYEHAVISTGGGTPIMVGNMEFINENGYSIYIKLDTTSLFHRLLNSKKQRPMINKYESEKLMQIVQSQLAIREIRYGMAHQIIDGINLQAQSLVDIIKEKLSNAESSL